MWGASSSSPTVEYSYFSSPLKSSEIIPETIPKTSSVKYVYLNLTWILYGVEVKFKFPAGKWFSFSQQEAVWYFCRNRGTSFLTSSEASVLRIHFICHSWDCGRQRPSSSDCFWEGYLKDSFTGRLQRSWSWRAGLQGLAGESACVCSGWSCCLQIQMAHDVTGKNLETCYKKERFYGSLCNVPIRCAWDGKKKERKDFPTPHSPAHLSTLDSTEKRKKKKNRRN